MPKTLLEKAQTFDISRKFKKMSNEELDVALALLKGELKFGQVKHVITSNPYAWAFARVRAAYRAGRIIINK